jgi:hypothetical protein
MDLLSRKDGYSAILLIEVTKNGASYDNRL